MDASNLYFSTIFLAGILSFLSPCIFPLLPVYFSILAKTDESGVEAQNETTLSNVKVSLRILVFILGISTTFIILGFGAGVLGSVINNDYFLVFLGLIVIILGIHQTGIIEFKIFNYQKSILKEPKIKNPYFSIYILGLSFSFGWTPCVGPILAAVLGVAASGENVIFSVLLMVIYSLGFSIPFFILGLFSNYLLKKVKFLNKYLGKLKIMGGVVIIIMGILLMTNALNQITVFFGGY